MTYALVEVSQDDPDTRQNRGSFNLENCTSEINTLGAFLYPPQYLQQYTPSQSEANMAYRDFEICFNTISAVCGSGSTKMWPLSAINGVRCEITLEDASGCLSYTAFPPKSDPIHMLYNTSGVDLETNRPMGVILRTPVTKHGQEVYYYAVTKAKTQAELNTAKTKLIADYNLNPFDHDLDQVYAGRLTVDDLKKISEKGYNKFANPWRPLNTRHKCRSLPQTIASKIRYEIFDPVLQMSTIVVPPSIDMQIRSQGMAMSPDGRIRLQNTSWQQFSTTIKWDENYISYTIPIHVASLKSLFFTITPNDNSQDINSDRTQFIMRNLSSYNFKLNGENILSSSCRVEYPYSESVAELLRAWSISLKDGGLPTMLRLDAYADNEKVVNNILQQPTDTIFGCDLEAFGSKSLVLDSGVNIRNSSLMFEANFRSGGERGREEWGERQTITFYALYDQYVSIDSTTGMISYEN